MARTCSIDGCTGRHNARGWCNMHYERWRKNGDPLNDGRPSLEQRLRANVTMTTSGCWQWTASTDGKYGVTRSDGRLQKAHRVSYELFVGQVPVGLDLDHLCRNTLCINPKHLEPVTRSENLRRGAAARKAEANA